MSNKPKNTVKNPEIDIHHCVPVSRWWTEKDANRQERRIVHHRSHHNLFWNDTPAEQLIRLLSLNSQVLRAERAEELKEAIQACEVDEIYENWIIKNDKIKPKK